MRSRSVTSADQALAGAYQAQRAVVAASSSGSSPTSATCAPRRARPRATAAPMPRAAPVTTAVLPLRLYGRVNEVTLVRGAAGVEAGSVAVCSVVVCSLMLSSLVNSFAVRRIR